MKILTIFFLLPFSLSAQAKVLYIVGMETEAKVVRAPNTQVLIGGGSATELASLLKHVDPRDYESVVHFGIVGGISRGLGFAEVVLPSSVKLADGRTWQPTSGMLGGLADRIRKCGLPFRWVVMTGADEPVGSVAQRAALWQATGADIVDTQIQVSAAWATEKGLAFVALGAVSDDWQTNLPPAALLPLTPQGTPDKKAVFRSILAHPGQIPALARVAKNTNAALAKLRKVILCIRAD